MTNFINSLNTTTIELKIDQVAAFLKRHVTKELLTNFGLECAHSAMLLLILRWLLSTNIITATLFLAVMTMMRKQVVA
jgi:hypothetical protein